jgi:catechol 2,3-dioxygenase-like lactoylglutathione lyase family enzyme
VRLRSARPTNDLAALERFYTALGCEVVGRFEDHQGFDGLILGGRDAAWQIEFVRERGVTAPRAPTPEHLLVFYLDDENELHRRAERLIGLGARELAAHNPYWAACARCFEDPDGYVAVLSLPSPRQLQKR